VLVAARDDGLSLKIYTFFEEGGFQPATMARILVIDDDADVRTLVLYELAAAGHEVRVAANGAKGLAMQRAAPADIVVTDIFMPEKEGVETIRDLKDEFPRIKIIAMTGGGTLGAPRRAVTMRDLGVIAGELGVVALLEKPFGSKELLQSVEAALSGS
jgi:CheY-like chemotaxis protein